MLHCSLSARECPGVCWLDRAQSKLALYCNLFITTIYVTHLKVCKRWEKERKKEIHTQCAHYLRVARSNTAMHAARVLMGVFVAVSSVEGRYHTVRQAQTWCKSVIFQRKDGRQKEREERRYLLCYSVCYQEYTLPSTNPPGYMNIFVTRCSFGEGGTVEQRLGPTRRHGEESLPWLWYYFVTTVWSDFEFSREAATRQNIDKSLKSFCPLFLENKS